MKRSDEVYPVSNDFGTAKSLNTASHRLNRGCRLIASKPLSILPLLMLHGRRDILTDDQLLALTSITTIPRPSTHFGLIRPPSRSETADKGSRRIRLITSAAELREWDTSF